MRVSLLATALAVALISLSPGAHAQSADSRDQELALLKEQLAALQAKVAELETRTDAQSDINVANAESANAAAESAKKVDAVAKLVNDTQVSGKMFVDLTSIDQENNGTKTAASGTGFDVKRFYIGINHKFDETWSANLTTDFQYVSSLDSAADIYVKKAYLQGKFSDALMLRAGSADMPWIPFAESYYGFRYIENPLVDRLKFGSSADWGLHAGGDLGGKTFNYAVSVVNGGGYKNPSRSKGMDVEARIGFVPLPGMVVALGGYSGKLAKETETVDALHTAKRADAMVAYAGKSLRLGGEYFRAEDWGNVLTVASDKASGYSAWASYVFDGRGVAVFGRYDKADLSKTLDPSLQETYYNFGVEVPVRKGVKVAAAYKNTHRENDTSIDLETREVGLWGEVSF